MMSVGRAAVSSLVLGAFGLALTAGRAGPQPGLPVNVGRYSDVQVDTRTYAVRDAAGTVTGTADWRVVRGTGNCCENYLAATPSGRLLDLGAEEIRYSDDRGRVWYRVASTVPFLAAEGAISAAPNGDVVGVTWDPYQGDRMIAFKYADGFWSESPVLLHNPFADRPWISVVPGPFRIGPMTVPYVTIVQAGWPVPDLWYVSLDGLTYGLPTVAVAEALARTTSSYLDVAPSVDLDFVQPANDADVTPLGAGRALASTLEAVDGLACPWMLMRMDLRWSCHELPEGGFGGPTTRPRVLADSAGRLHEITPPEADGSWTYRISSDGGRSWSSTTFAFPPGFAFEHDFVSSGEWDFRVNAQAATTALAVTAYRASTGKHKQLVFKFSVGSTATLTKIMDVGFGDYHLGGGLGAGSERYDFVTLAIFPDGKVAVSFADSLHTDPAVAIEL